MLNIFPAFLIPFLAPTILRIGIGATLFLDSGTVLKNKPKKQVELVSAVLTLISSALLVIGLFTQIAALYIFIDTLFRLTRSEYRKKERSRTFYLILAAAALSLFISGAGAFALDVPL